MMFTMDFSKFAPAMSRMDFFFNSSLFVQSTKLAKHEFTWYQYLPDIIEDLKFIKETELKHS